MLPQKHFAQTITVTDEEMGGMVWEPHQKLGVRYIPLKAGFSESSQVPFISHHQAGVMTLVRFNFTRSYFSMNFQTLLQMD